jgi:MoaA/NifB/PqqE/SkfB family radical SAM enzyme
VADPSPTGIAPVLQVHPTRRCNIACAHCYSSSGPTAREELPGELLSACITDAAALGYRQLAVSGGEPLVYPALPRLLERARRFGMLTTVTTNGMLLTHRRFDPLVPFLDVLAISIDGRPREHDAIRRRDGAFARTIGNLATVRGSGVPFGFVFTLTQHNADSLDFVVRLAAQEGARSVQVHPLTLHGRAAATMDGERPDETELATALFEAARLGLELGVAIHVDAVTGRQLLLFRRAFVPERPVRSLRAVAPVLVVRPDAVVVPLTHEIDPALVLGSLHEQPLGALARRFVREGRADELAEVCARTWEDLVDGAPPPAVYWYDEVALRSAPVPA